MAGGKRYKKDFDQIKCNRKNSVINLVQFLQRLPDQTFAKILAEKVEKQVIAVSHGEAVQQSPA